MKYRKITAIIRCEALEDVERELKEAGVHGISVTKVKGFGEYADFFTRDWMVTHIRMEIFTKADKAEAIAGLIMDAACAGAPGDGIVAILPVERIYRIRTKSEVTAHDL